jgi:hypothetical protein
MHADALPQYFWVNRFDLYRTNSLGHNTLTFDKCGGGLENALIVDLLAAVTCCSRLLCSISQSCVVTGKYSSNCPPVPMTLLNVSTPAAPLPDGIDAYAVVNATAAWAFTGLVRVQRGFVSMQVSQVVC